MPRKIQTTVSTRYSLTDDKGTALCHGASATKSAQDNIREAVAWCYVMEIARRLNRLTGNHRVITASGVARARHAGQSSRIGAVDLGHVVADEMGGPYCLCNLVPQDGLDNLTELTPTMREGFEREWFTMAQTVMTEADPFANTSPAIRERLVTLRIELVRRQTGKVVSRAEAASFTYKWMPASKRARIAA